MDIVEQAVTFDCAGEQLVGVVAVPDRPGSLGVVIVIGGPNYRAGSHRQFVHLARRLAAAGIAVLRFDYRGMGDATGPMRELDNVTPDVEAAIVALQANCPTVKRVALWGLCAGASSVLIYCATTRDTRIVGIVLVNPWVRSEATLAKTYLKHYYRRRLFSAAFWLRFAAGSVNVGAALRSLMRSVNAARSRLRQGERRAAPSFQDGMAEGLKSFAGPVLILLSNDDLTAREFLEYAGNDAGWHGLIARANVERRDIAEADHTFSSGRWRGEMETRTLAWLNERFLPAR